MGAAQLQRESEGNLKRAFPGRGNPQDAELAQLQRDYARLKMENEILKKAVGIFTRESMPRCAAHLSR